MQSKRNFDKDLAISESKIKTSESVSKHCLLNNQVNSNSTHHCDK